MTKDNKNRDEKISTNPLVLRQSIFFVVLRIMTLEIVFDSIYTVIRLPLFYFNIPYLAKIGLIPFYFVIFIFLSIIKLFFILYISLKWLTTYYEISHREIKFKWGILKIKERIYSSSHMQEIEYEQSLVGRIFNFGSIFIYSPSLKEKIILYQIPNPKEYEELIKADILESAKVSYAAD